MRCLYCGKELALFKRLRGGEFCSDAHRQRYQAEYTQLALNRLLQANTPKESDAGGSTEVGLIQEDTTSLNGAGKLNGAARHNGAALHEPESAVKLAAVQTAVIEPVATPAPIEDQPRPEEPPPAGMSGFLVERPVPVVVDAPAPLNGSTPLPSPAALAFPRFKRVKAASANAGLGPAVRVAMPMFGVTDFPTPPRVRALEVREFVRGGPLVEIQARPAAESRFEAVTKTQAWSLLPHPPAGSASLWVAPEVGFPESQQPPEILLGDLARLDFALTDWGGIEEDSTPEATVAGPAPLQPVKLEAQWKEPAPRPSSRPEPLRFEPVHIDPVFMEKIAGATALATPPPPSPPPAPPSVTQPLPVTLHGLAPGKGKPVQVFTTALVRTGDVQIPPGAGLPLRPAMILGPAPKTGIPAPKTGLKEAVVPIKPPAIAAAPVKRPELVLRQIPKPEPAPVEDLDLLGLPKLSFKQKEGFWSRLPNAAKFGGIGLVLALIIGALALTSRGSGSAKPATPAPVEPVYVEEPALGSTAGWAEDWFVDRPGAKQGRHVDVLKGSLTLRDYRMVFEGQIQSGALGWVYRASGTSFYVEKIQLVTPGRQPVVALVRFAVIDGKEQPRVQVPMSKGHLDTSYKVRMDVIGDRFTTWVQDQQIDQWTDGQLSVGGVGLYYDGGDSANLRDTLNVIPLRKK